MDLINLETGEVRKLSKEEENRLNNFETKLDKLKMKYGDFTKINLKLETYDDLIEEIKEM